MEHVLCLMTIIQNHSHESCVVGTVAGEIVSYPIEEALAMEKSIDLDTYRMAHEISI